MRRSTLHAVLALCVLTAGCSVLGPDYTRDDRAVRALDSATAAPDTYRFASNLTVTATVDGRTERVDATVTGAVDPAEREMRTTSFSDGETRRVYVTNRTVYRECSETWGGWGVDERDDEGAWLDGTPAARQLSLLESGSLYWNGTERVDGQRATRLTGEPTAEALTEYREDRSRQLLSGPSVDDAELRAWLDADTGRLLRTELRFDISEGDATASTTMNTTFSRYGEPVTVDLPEEARSNQYELGCPGGPS